MPRTHSHSGSISTLPASPTSPFIRTAPPPPPSAFTFDDFGDDDDGGWQSMPVVEDDLDASGFDEEDRKKYRYTAENTTKKNVQNATGDLIDFDDDGSEWRSKLKTDVAESEYTRLRVHEDESDAADEMQLRTKYLFDEDQAMTPLAQMATTKKLLTEAQRIAYVGVCQLTIKEMSDALKARLDTRGKPRKTDKPLTAAKKHLDLWALKIMGRLYYHMELATQEQKMIESLAEHGVIVSDLVPSLITTHTVKNPDYDPEEARLHREEVQRLKDEEEEEEDDDDDRTLAEEPEEPIKAKQPPSESETHSPSSDVPSDKLPDVPPTPSTASIPQTPLTANGAVPTPLLSGIPSMKATTTQVLPDTTTSVPGLSTSLNSYEEDVTLDIRWTLLCDLFLVLTADSVYDSRSRVLLEQVANHLGLGWKDLVRFEGRVTEALEIEEAVEKERLGEGKQEDILQGVIKKNRNKRYMMLGLATVGGGLVIGLSAGLLAPVIGVGLAGAFTTVGITGTAGFLGGVGGAAVITTGGVLTGSGIAARGMANRTRQVRTFDILPLHNNKRVSCILTVPGFLSGPLDDPRLPFSVLDPVVGDVFSVLWEPEMIRETGSAIKILTQEVLTQLGQTVLGATIMATLMSALAWPIILTKLGYLIDNPWSNALDRAKAAGHVLADVLIQRHLGVRPITLIGFSLGARVIWYALLELARQKAYGIVQDVFILGSTISSSTENWCTTRSVVSGRYVNAYARNDWVLNYLFRASAGGINAVAGLRPIEDVPGLENVDVTDKIAGHMSYRTFMPLILDQLGFPVERDYFDDPQEPDFEEDHAAATEQAQKDLKTERAWFGKGKAKMRPQSVSRPPSGFKLFNKKSSTDSPNGANDDDDLPPRETDSPPTTGASTPEEDPTLAKIPKHAGFDFSAIKAAIKEEKERDGGVNKDGMKMAPPTNSFSAPSIPPPTNRTESTPNLIREEDEDEDDDGRKTPTRADFANGSPSAFAGAGARARSASPAAPSHAFGEPSTRDPSPPPVPRKEISPYTPSPSWADNPFASTTSLSSSSSSPSPTVPVKSSSGWGFSSPSLSFGNDFGSNGLTFGHSDGISFGGSDGSIQNGNGSGKDDPWKMPPLPTKKEEFGSNPWG